jgi:glycerol kinase
MRAGYVLAIDQGTTGSTVLIFDHDGQIRGRAYSNLPSITPSRAGWSTTPRKSG